jgi:DNA-binding transcriptional LysR family regulator
LNFNSASLPIDAAINVQGVAIAPSQFVDRDIAKSRLREIWKDPEPSGEAIFLVWPKQRVPFKPLMDVVRWVHAEFGLDVVD